MKTLQRRAPPRARIASRARAMCGASGESPDRLQREIGLDRGAEVERRRRETAASRRRVPWSRAECTGDARLELRLDACRDNAAAGCIRPGSSHRPRARRPSGRRRAAARSAHATARATASSSRAIAGRRLIAELALSAEIPSFMAGARCVLARLAVLAGTDAVGRPRRWDAASTRACRAAAKPERIAPSIVAGKPVST